MPRSNDEGLFDEFESEPEDATPEWLRRQLERAVTGADLGVPHLWATERRARFALRLVGAGGTVDFARPATVRRAILRLNASRVRSEE